MNFVYFYRTSVYFLFINKQKNGPPLFSVYCNRKKEGLSTVNNSPTIHGPKYVTRVSRHQFSSMTDLTLEETLDTIQYRETGRSQRKHI